MVNRLESLSKYLARNLAGMRAARGLTQGELARLAELPRSTLTHLESGGGNPSLANLARLAEALQVSIEELIAQPRADCQLVKARDVSGKSYDSGRVDVFKLL